MIAQAKPAPAKPVPAKAKAPKPVLAKAMPAKSRTLAAAAPAKPKPQAGPTDSGPWFSKLEAVLKRPSEAARQHRYQEMAEMIDRFPIQSLPVPASRAKCSDGLFFRHNFCRLGSRSPSARR